MNDYTTQTRIPFWYSFPVAILTNGSNDTKGLTIETNSAFECWKVLISCTADGDTDTNPNNVTIRLQDNGTGRFLSGAQIAQRIISPISGENRFPTPVIFAPSSTLVCEYTDLSAGANSVSVVLQGFKLFG